MYALQWTTTDIGRDPAPASAGYELCARAPNGSVRDVLRAIATEPAADRRRWLERVHPLVDREHAMLRARFEADGRVEALMRGRTRLADEAVVGLLSLARAAVAGGPVTAIPSVTIIAVGGYGRRELAPASDLDLLFLVADPLGPNADAERLIGFVLAGLWDLGFAVGHATRTLTECRALGEADPTVLASLLDARFLAGSCGSYALLDASFKGAANGARIESLATAIADEAKADAARVFADDRSDDQPDVKRDPGGLRDTQRLLWLARLAGRSDQGGQPGGSRVPAALIQSRRFLWQVRVNLHLLAGRAQDRLLRDLQPPIANRIGLEDRGAGTAAAKLLELYRGHTRSVRAMLRT